MSITGVAEADKEGGGKHITGAGSCTITASQAGDSNYSAVSTSALLNIGKATPAITWSNPADITYGTALGATQLNATASVAGSFVYTPAVATVLSEGNGQTLQVDFTPTDTANYNTASKNVVINVVSPTKTTPTITWNNPADITYATALSGTQLNATASVAGTFVYTPAAGTVLNAGNGQTLHVDFTPTDTANYNTASKDVMINVVAPATSSGSGGTSPDRDATSPGSGTASPGSGTTRAKRCRRLRGILLQRLSSMARSLAESS